MHLFKVVLVLMIVNETINSGFSTIKWDFLSRFKEEAPNLFSKCILLKSITLNDSVVKGGRKTSSRQMKRYHRSIKLSLNRKLKQSSN